MLSGNRETHWAARQLSHNQGRERGTVMDVRAAVALKAGQPLEITTVQPEGPREGEVLVEVSATGVSRIGFELMKLGKSIRRVVTL
jgi:hypothetical protein